MLYLVTGTPGAGKTLNTIKFINEDKRFHEVAGKPRDVYYHGIRNLNDEFGWHELDADQAQKWYDLPSGSVIVFDEAYTVFPVRHGSQKPPIHVEKLATHRHHGYDIVMICQKVTGQLDPFIRGLVGQHRHYARIMGSKNVNCYVWDACQEAPNSKGVKQLANVTPVRLDKKYFGAYHSADEHTHKLNLPWLNIIWLCVALALIAGAVWFAYTRLFADDSPSALRPSANSDSEQTTVRASGAAQSKELTYSDSFTPEVTALPWSAPAYRDVIQARTWPRPAACVFWHDRNMTVCYSQQGTRMYIPEDIARQIVKDGFFDWTKEEPTQQFTDDQYALDDSAPSGGARHREREAHSMTGGAAGGGLSSRVKIIEHKPTRMQVEGRQRPTAKDVPSYNLIPSG